jgi:hypothetical protein
VASGVVCIDEVYEKPCGLVLVTDPNEDLILDFYAAERMDGEGVHAFLKDLCGGGLAVRGGTTDGSPLYRDGKLNTVWSDFVHQRCLFHLLNEANRDVLRAVRQVHRSLPKPPRRRPGRRRKGEPPPPEPLDVRAFLGRHRLLITTRPDHLTDVGRERLATLLDAVPELPVLRRFVRQLHRLVRPDQPAAEARRMRDVMLAETAYRAWPQLVRILDRLAGAKLEPFIAYLTYPELPRTSNHVEGKNRRFRLVQKTRYKRRKAHTIVNAMKLELMEQKRRWEAAHQQRPALPPEVFQALSANSQAPSAA